MAKTGSSFADFLKERGVYDEVTSIARRKVEEWQRKHQPKTSNGLNDGSLRVSDHSAMEQSSAQ